ncbi:endocuticle structural glycoprotein SgAbd-8-like [Macrobrachium nipponense]|uniref:endocuticle structural glycoprotein SgAbd-8-like n=1 Tax=Macrobrachium nipponense TaxID=159736 RepID=UPI0030C89BFD
MNLFLLQVILTALAAAALAAPQYGYEAPRGSIRGGGDSSEEAAILRDDRDRDDSGRYSVAVETENGIRLTDSGAPGAKGAIAASGSFSYTAPDGTPVSPAVRRRRERLPAQSDLLPVAPAFPHPSPSPSSSWTRSPSPLRKTAGASQFHLPRDLTPLHDFLICRLIRILDE